MDTSGRSPRHRLGALLAGLAATRSDAAALAVLALGAVGLLALLWWVQRPELAAPAAAAGGHPGGLVELAEPELVVHVAGLVRRPGIHRVPAGARVADALAAAGGALPEGWVDGLNLARRVEDGEQLLVPAAPDPSEPGGSPADAGAGAPAGGIAPDGRVLLNRASAAELETLPGIGPVMAGRIVEHREQHGPFAAVGELRDVPGIGEKTLQGLVDSVSL